MIGSHLVLIEVTAAIRGRFQSVGCPAAMITFQRGRKVINKNRCECSSQNEEGDPNHPAGSTASSLESVVGNTILYYVQHVALFETRPQVNQIVSSHFIPADSIRQ